MLFNPRLILTTDAAKSSQLTYALYKSIDEYIICDFLERDHFIAAGYSPNPSDFATKEEDPDKEVKELAEKVSKKRGSVPKKDKKINTIVDEEGNAIALDEHGNNISLNKTFADSYFVKKG